MSERTYLARHRTFEVLAAAKEYSGIGQVFMLSSVLGTNCNIQVRRYIKSGLNDPKDPEHWQARYPTDMPWTALHSSDELICSVKPARDLLSGVNLCVCLISCETGLQNICWTQKLRTPRV